MTNTEIVEVLHEIDSLLAYLREYSLRDPMTLDNRLSEVQKDLRKIINALHEEDKQQQTQDQ